MKVHKSDPNPVDEAGGDVAQQRKLVAESLHTMPAPLPFETEIHA